MKHHLTFAYFHISMPARRKYNIDDALFSYHSRLIIANHSQARAVAEKINSLRQSENNSALVTPGLINAAALLHEITHFLIREYDKIENPGCIGRFLNEFSETDRESVEKLFVDFVEKFPPQELVMQAMSAAEYLASSIEGKPAREVVFEEMLLLHLENRNLALQPISEFFDSSHLEQKELFRSAVEKSAKFFEQEFAAGRAGRDFYSLLLQPILKHPHNLEAQLNELLISSGTNIQELLSKRILLARDLFSEEVRLYHVHGTFSKPSPPVPVYTSNSHNEVRLAGGTRPLRTPSIDEISSSYFSEQEQFSEDLDWMPRVVMIAKNTYVWLDQLSKKYSRDIRTLDKIPDEELDSLRDWNFTALWLIGVWERSTASKKIKQFCGNHDAVSSAYSVYDYNIAPELGGYYAYDNLKNRCSARGIRLASDMVPNHTGIFSKWVIEHPGYFIQSEKPPYPNYSFTGPNLSEDPHIEVRIEDRYYTKADAAVVFERLDRRSGEVRYLYHGNDGTNMPWNDTAQLNILIPEVREALVQEIKHIASLFPIIRFDAAMTLSKKHFQRLWFPQPGTGGAVPSRSDYSMDKSTFDILMPSEFWRDVVDRINSELPNTLLLAEAFWLMEGYFVRTLGMHRVYNSAFMHMFMKEENEKYRELIKNTLEFNPEILKRYVNFMSNPDEETAVNQFGKGDKYIGVCVMMLTLPGLPMFAHGQIEGLTEKYGMEYQRAYYNEYPDAYLIERHRREIFPLSAQRILFSEVHNFRLFDCRRNDGSIDHNLFAFTNARGNRKVLVCYNNSYEAASGTIHYSSPKILGDAISLDAAQFETIPLSVALDMTYDEIEYLKAFESRTGQFYLFKSTDVIQNGLNIKLNGYAYHVFIFTEKMRDESGILFKLYNDNPQRGYSDIEVEIRRMTVAPFHLALERAFAAPVLQDIANSLIKEFSVESRDIIINNFSPLFAELRNLKYEIGTCETFADNSLAELAAFSQFIKMLHSNEKQKKRRIGYLHRFTEKYFTTANTPYVYFLITAILIKHMLKELKTSISLLQSFHALLLKEEIWQVLIRASSDYSLIYNEYHLLDVILRQHDYHVKEGSKSRDCTTLTRGLLLLELEEPDTLEFLGRNIWNEAEYFNKENYEFLVDFILMYVCIQQTVALRAEKTAKGKKKAPVTVERELKKLLSGGADSNDRLRTVLDQSEFRLNKLKALLTAFLPPDMREKKSARTQKKQLVKSTTRKENAGRK